MAIRTGIAGARTAAGIPTQTELAARMHDATGDSWPLSRMSKVERGIEVLGWKELRRLAEILGVFPQELYPVGVLQNLRKEPGDPPVREVAEEELVTAG